MKTKTKPTSVDEYIAAAAPEAQAKLKQMRVCLRQAAPGAVESLKWGAPSFSYQRILFTFAAAKKHIGFYPTPSAVAAFADDLAGFKTGLGSIQFPLDKPLPRPLIRKMAAFRVRELKKKDAKWM